MGVRPDKGEVGGSSPPRPTIFPLKKVLSEELTFLSGKSVLYTHDTVCINMKKKTVKKTPTKPQSWSLYKGMQLYKRPRSDFFYTLCG